ncbi:MauE/DoxX family redox-associated membrane protein [Emticicia sp. BO119]|uniref:DoxX family protein n=1 Tax=Emticicia sp. BO119 TaxID=2757768 RepID=UPI0015F08265|nr:MauE/DoxX family redox-associated membrane protein [Emticicia sp. BO119]MBA4850123.1 DoxX family protein [Emticicia sp. BO119]
MPIIKIISLYIAAILFIFAGISHFRKERFYMKTMPVYIPYHKAMVLISGIAEIVLGLGLLIPLTRIYASWGLILLLIAVFPANIYMATSGRFHRIPAILLWLRLPLQFVLIWWIYQYT